MFDSLLIDGAQGRRIAQEQQIKIRRTCEMHKNAPKNAVAT
jgi:hypothetical protein